MITHGRVPRMLTSGAFRGAVQLGAQHDVGLRPPVPLGLGSRGALLADVGPDCTPVAASPLQVTLIEFGLMRLVKTTLEAARRCVDVEMDAVAAASKEPKVRAGFDVISGKLISAERIRELGPTEFIVCLMPNSDTKAAFSLVRKHFVIPNEKKDSTLAGVAAQMKVDGGVNVRVAGKSVSIAAVNRYAAEVSGPMSDREREETSAKAGKMPAELILHELGHAMGAVHGKGLMSSPLVQAMDQPVQHFSLKSRREILKTLEVLVKKK